jgi:hypothetical protein
MQRNTLFGGIALLLAGGVIGAGAMISSSAMADEGATPPANEVTMINVGADGEAVQCTFSGAEADGLFPEFPAMALPTEGVDAPVLSGSGVIEVDPNNLPDGVEIGSVVASGAVSVQVDAATGEIVENSEALPLPDDVQVLSMDDAREGTPEECAAMRDQAVSGVPAEGGMVIGATGTISATAGVEPTQP